MEAGDSSCTFSSAFLAGLVTSMTNFAGSVSRNMDHLSMDSNHQEMQDDARRRHSVGMSSAFQHGISCFSLCLLGESCLLFMDYVLPYFLIAAGEHG